MASTSRASTSTHSNQSRGPSPPRSSKDFGEHTRWLLSRERLHGTRTSAPSTSSAKAAGSAASGGSPSMQPRTVSSPARRASSARRGMHTASPCRAMAAASLSSDSSGSTLGLTDLDDAGRLRLIVPTAVSREAVYAESRALSPDGGQLVSLQTQPGSRHQTNLVLRDMTAGTNSGRILRTIDDIRGTSRSRGGTPPAPDFHSATTSATRTRSVIKCAATRSGRHSAAARRSRPHSQPMAWSPIFRATGRPTTAPSREQPAFTSKAAIPSYCCRSTSPRTPNCPRSLLRQTAGAIL